MDNQSSYVRSGIGGSNNGDDERNMDLSLKIGLPYQNDNQHHVNPIRPDSNHLPNFNFINPYISHQELGSDSRMINGGGQDIINAIGMLNMPSPNAINYGMGNMASNIGNAMANMNLNASSVPWPSEHLGNYYMNNNIGSQHLQYNNTSPAGSVVGIPIMPRPPYANNFNYGDQAISTASSGSSSSPSSSSRRKESRRQRSGTYIDMNKRCTNFNCNTNDTPMWRKGPLGPKTLCNACGIKYRKEAERKRAKEAEKNNNA